MNHEDCPSCEPGLSERSSATTERRIPERVHALREKASKLSETLARVEETLREASGETKE